MFQVLCIDSHLIVTQLAVGSLAPLYGEGTELQPWHDGVGPDGQSLAGTPVGLFRSLAFLNTWCCPQSWTMLLFEREILLLWMGSPVTFYHGLQVEK